MAKTLPLIFFGSNDFSIYVLKEFLKKYKPILVLTLKRKPQGRGLKIEPNIVYKFCLKEKLNVIEFDNHRLTQIKISTDNHGSNSARININKNTYENQSEIHKNPWNKFKKELELIKPLVGVIAGFSKIIPPEIIKVFPKGILNVHPSLLPKYQGPNPIREVILNGEKETGVSIILIDQLIDHGPIVTQKVYPLNGNEEYQKLQQDLGRFGGKLLNEIIDDYLNGKINLKDQDHNLATYTKKIKKENGLLNLEDSFINWDRKIRALNPWPGTFFYLNGKIFKIFKIEKIDKKNLPKEILKTKIGKFFTFKNELGLRLKDAFIYLKEVQLEGRKKMSGKEFLNGFRKIVFKD